MNPSFETHLLCMEQGIRYEREDHSICPKCEQEICEEHDKLVEEDV